MQRVLVIGGRGFAGSAICNELKKRKKYPVFTFDRHSGAKNHFQGNIKSLADLRKAFRGMNIVINLVGLSPLRKPKSLTYHQAHVEGVKNIIKACKELKIKKLIHMSILGADEKSDIEFARTKGLGEELVLNSKIKSTVFCPSVIFDKENELVRLARKFSFTMSFPTIPAKIQPVYRRDIAKLFSLAVEGKIKQKKLEIGGPDIMAIFEFAKKIYNKKGFPCIPAPLVMFKLCMKAASFLNLSGITQDQIKSLYIDNITKSDKASKYIKLKSFDYWLKSVKL